MLEQEQFTQKGSTSPSGLYLHLPFCRSKCPYCDFYSIASLSLVPRWLESLKKEILYYKDKFGCFDTIYLGGGTPSFLENKTIEEILSFLKAEYDFSEDTEITIEANPRDLTPEKLTGIKLLGINRINLGVQSFHDKELQFLGRSHRAADLEKTLDNIKSAGFENIGIDLIFGLKDQSLEVWKYSLKRAVSFNPEHISCYQLTIEGKTVFNAMKNKGLLKEFSEDAASNFFLETSELLEQEGYIHYEISNFARGMEYRSRHNSKYWQRTPYLGLGPSAHSFDGKKRWWNYRSVKNYCKSLENENTPVEDFEVLSDEQVILEKVSLGLRTIDGVSIDGLTEIPGVLENIQKLKASGHIVIINNRVVPTKKGFLVADQLPLFIISQS